MPNPTNWPIITDAETYFRQNEKQALHEQRRPTAGNGSSVLGPGFAPNASEITDWNSDEATFNGYFWATVEAANGPARTGTDLDEDSIWIGHSVSTGTGGIQIARTHFVPGLSATQVTGPVEVSRRWVFDESVGLRFYTPWAHGAPQQVAMTTDANVTATSPAAWWNGAPPDSPFDVPQATNVLYIPSTSTLIHVTVCLTIDNSNDTLNLYREVRFWPTFDGSVTAPHAASGAEGRWSHYGRGTAGWNETETVSRSWWLYPPNAGALSPGVVVFAPSGDKGVAQIDSYWHMVQ